MSDLTNMSGYTHSSTNSVGYFKATIMVFSLLSPLISFLDPKLQMISVSLMRHLYTMARSDAPF